MRIALQLTATLLPTLLAAQAAPIGPTPLTTIHATSPDGEVVIERIADAALLPDGGVVVADGPANSLLFFDATGKLVRRAGGTGDGPGEFRRLWGVEVCGDEVVAYEMMANTLQRYTSRGVPAGAVTLAARVTAMTPLRCGPGGGYVGLVEPRPAVQPDPGASPVPFTASVALFNASGAEVARTAVDSALSMVMIRGGVAPSPLGPMLSFASTGERVVFGTGAHPFIGVMNRGGSVGRAPLSLEAGRVTDADRKRGAEAWLELVPPAMRETLAAQYEALPVPSHLPYYRRILPAPGSIVLLEVTGPGTVKPRYIPTDGLSRGAPFELPVAGQLLAVTSDRALILVTDEDGEQRLQIHAVRGVATLPGPARARSPAVTSGKEAVVLRPP